MKLPFDSIKQLSKLNANKVSAMLQSKFKFCRDEIAGILALMQYLSDVRLEARLLKLSSNDQDKNQSITPGADCEFEVDIYFPFTSNKSQLDFDTSSWWLLVTHSPLLTDEEDVYSSELIVLKRLGRLSSKSLVSISLKIPEEPGLEKFHLKARLLNDIYLGIESSIIHTVSLVS